MVYEERTRDPYVWLAAARDTQSKYYGMLIALHVFKMCHYWESKYKSSTLLIGLG